MIRIPGILKVSAVLIIDFFVLYSLLDHSSLALLLTGIIAAYVFLWGNLDIAREGGVGADQLPVYDRERLDEAKAQLAEDVLRESSVDISGLKIFLIPGDEGMQASAYGFNCVSVSRGTLANADPVTLKAVLAHEVSHILNSDAEFSRAVFCSVTMLVAALSVVLAVTVLVLFFVFLLLCFFRSFLGYLAFRGTMNLFKGFFSLIQKVVVVIYRSLLGIANRAAEYRSDRYACELGYGLQLSHFLECAGNDPDRQMTITEMLYQSHPPTPSRLARIEQYMIEAQGPEE